MVVDKTHTSENPSYTLTKTVMVAKLQVCKELANVTALAGILVNKDHKTNAVGKADLSPKLEICEELVTNKLMYTST